MLKPNSISKRELPSVSHNLKCLLQVNFASRRCCIEGQVNFSDGHSKVALVPSLCIEETENQEDYDKESLEVHFYTLKTALDDYILQMIVDPSNEAPDNSNSNSNSDGDNSEGKVDSFTTFDTDSSNESDQSAENTFPK